jgi:hypothetical protein
MVDAPGENMLSGGGHGLGMGRVDCDGDRRRGAPLRGLGDRLKTYRTAGDALFLRTAM